MTQFTRADGVSLREYLEFRLDAIEERQARLEAKVSDLEQTRAELAGKADNGVVNRVLLISGTSLVLAVVGLVLRLYGV